MKLHSKHGSFLDKGFQEVTCCKGCRWCHPHPER